ncbi:MAG: SOS response-associated peptidase [Acidimicrobiia bacterium]|nr:SOS response-associated peptidase [Acidimicrobiia bacterium]
MCGRFVSSSTPDEIARYFGVDTVGDAVAEMALEPNYNTAPTSTIYAIRERDDRRILDALHWGLVPFWAKEVKIGNRMINARAETLAEKNSYKRPFAKRRCIIPVDGFYEWEKIPGQKHKQPWYIQRRDGDPLAFAGLWEYWRGPDRDGSDELVSCTIITGSPNESMAEIHDRMPVMLPPDTWDRWLDPDMHDIGQLQELFVPAPSELLVKHRVSTEVNNVRNRGPRLIEPHEPDDRTLPLDAD